MGRLSIVTEAGEPASEEFTLPLIANHELAKKSGAVVTNCCTSRAVDDIAAVHGATIIKTPVGQAYVVSALADEMGVIGGEGSGSVALPRFSRAFDGFLMMGLILEAMAVSGQRVSDMIHKLPKYHMVKRRVVCGSRDGYAALEALKEQSTQAPGARVDLTDGLRIDWDDGWVHVRPSRTEQLVRVISEATAKEAAERRADETVRALDQII
jgi:phosphomannomutase